MLFGFRHNHSVYMSLIILVDKIITSLNNGDYSIELFLDFKKAFDTINHDILINAPWRCSNNPTNFIFKLVI